MKLFKIAVHKGVEPLPQDRQSSILTVIRMNYKKEEYISLELFLVRPFDPSALLRESL